MPYTIKASARGKLVIVRHSGDVVCPEFEDIVHDLGQRIDPFHPPHMLIDVRNASSYPTSTEYFNWLSDRNLPPPIVDRIAFVTNRVHSDTIEAIAVAYMDRGCNVRVFCSELDALQWLFDRVEAKLETGSPPE